MDPAVVARETSPLRWIEREKDLMPFNATMAEVTTYPAYGSVTQETLKSSFFYAFCSTADFAEYTSCSRRASNHCPPRC